jgi:hypothetical protein
VIVRPSTVLRWHRKGWRLYWSWRSRTKLGRLRLNNETRDLIARMGRENPRWGTERIRSELLKLGIVVSNRSIRRYRWRKPAPADSQVSMSATSAGCSSNLPTITTLTDLTAACAWPAQSPLRSPASARLRPAWCWGGFITSTIEQLELDRHLPP